MAKIIQELGEVPSCYAVAKYYKDIIDIFVIDEIDYKYERLIRNLGMQVVILPTIMYSLKDKMILAKNILLTPHLGASTFEAKEGVSVGICRQISDFLIKGKLSNPINMPFSDLKKCSWF